MHGKLELRTLGFGRAVDAPFDRTVCASEATGSALNSEPVFGAQERVAFVPFHVQLDTNEGLSGKERDALHDARAPQFVRRLNRTALQFGLLPFDPPNLARIAFVDIPRFPLAWPVDIRH